MGPTCWSLNAGAVSSSDSQDCSTCSRCGSTDWQVLCGGNLNTNAVLNGNPFSVSTGPALASSVTVAINTQGLGVPRHLGQRSTTTVNKSPLSIALKRRFKRLMSSRIGEHPGSLLQVTHTAEHTHTRRWGVSYSQGWFERVTSAAFAVELSDFAVMEVITWSNPRNSDFRNDTGQACWSMKLPGV